VSGASTLPGHAGKGGRELQFGGASRADGNLEGNAIKAWLNGTRPVGAGWDLPGPSAYHDSGWRAQGLRGERHTWSPAPDHGLTFWPLRLLLCKVGWLQIPYKPPMLLLQNFAKPFASQQHIPC